MATLEAHATAVSQAVDACGCLTDTVAATIANADVYIELVAKASSSATASVCIEGTSWPVPVSMMVLRK